MSLLILVLEIKDTIDTAMSASYLDNTSKLTVRTG